MNTMSSDTSHTVWGGRERGSDKEDWRKRGRGRKRDREDGRETEGEREGRERAFITIAVQRVKCSSQVGDTLTPSNNALVDSSVGKLTPRVYRA